jgi:hypothetical protein
MKATTPNEIPIPIPIRAAAGVGDLALDGGDDADDVDLAYELFSDERLIAIVGAGSDDWALVTDGLVDCTTRFVVELSTLIAGVCKREVVVEGGGEVDAGVVPGD